MNPAGRLTPARRPLTEFLAAAVLVAAVVFNAVLAVVNAQLKSLTPELVIVCELLIVVAAHAIALLHFRARMTPWYALIAVMAAFAVFRSAALGYVEVKYFRDVLLIPTFIVLGMTYPRERLPRLLVLLQLLILAGMVLEAGWLDTYASLFDIKTYYINTRGYTDQDFWNTGSTLFVSASRPDDRFFSFVDFHRMSSVFLEPVSLGNYCIIIAAYVFASYRTLTVWQRIILLGGTAVLIVGCDGRLAAVSCLIIAVTSLFATWAPRRFVIVLPLAVLIAAIAAVLFFGFRAGPDDFSGRIAHTVALLRDYGLPEFLGVSDVYLSKAVDSGLAYLITTQSLFGTLVLWLFIALFAAERTRQEVVFKTAAALYLSLSMLVSFSFLSIKTAALLWFILGAMQSGRVTLSAVSWSRMRSPALAPNR